MKRTEFYWLMAAIYLTNQIGEMTAICLATFWCVLALMAEYVEHKAAA